MPSFGFAAGQRVNLGLVAGLALLLCGCPLTTRYPVLQTEDAETARQTSQLNDPFPDKHLGPDAEFRPREFGDPRAEAHLAKSRSYLTRLRIQASPAGGPPGAMAVPPVRGAVQYPAGSYPPPPAMGLRPAPYLGNPQRPL